MIMIEIKCMLGKRIKELREKRGLTQQELSELAGIDQRNLSKIECGVTFPSKSLAELAKALDISLPHLFEFEHVILTPKGMRETIKSRLEQLKDDDIKIIYRLVNTMYQ